MPPPGAIRAGKAYIELGLNSRALASGLRRASAKLRAFAASVETVGRNILRLSAALALPLGIGVKLFADFEEQMAKVSTMLDRPQAHMTTFRKGVRGMAVEFGESTETLANGLYDILSASIAAEKGLDTLRVSSKAAVAGMTDTKTAADAITTVLNSYGLEAEKAGAASDLLFAVVKRGKITFEELAPSIGNVTSIAATAGVPLTELGASIALLTRKGIRAEHAVTAMRAVVTTFIKPTAAASEVAAELGFEMSTAAIKSEGLYAILKRISTLSETDIGRLFPNIRALKGVLPALASLEALGGDIELMQNSAGATEKAYQKMAATMMFQFRRLRAVAVWAFAAIGEALAGPVRKGIDVVMRAGRMIAEWAENNKEIIRTFAKIVVIIGAVGIGLLALSLAIKILAFGLGGLAAVIGVIGAALSTLGAIAAAVLSPLGLLIGSTAVLAVFVLKSTGVMGQALDWLGGRFTQLKKDGMAAWKGIADALAVGEIGLAAKILWLTLKLWWKKGIGWLTNLWVHFKTSFLRVTTEIWYGALIVATNAWAAMETAWVKTTTFMANVWTVFGRTVGSIWRKIRGVVEKELLYIMSLHDETIDVEAARRHVDLRIEHKEREAEKQAGKTIRKREDERARRLSEIEATRRGTVSDLDRRADEAQAARKKMHQAELDASQAALQEARQEWRAAIAKAAGKRAAADADAAAADDAPEAPDFESLKAGMMDLGRDLTKLSDVSKRRARGMDVTGTFNALVAASLGLGQTAQERTATATEKTAKNTKAIADQVTGGGLAFS